MHLIQVPLEAFDQIWPQAEKHVARACELSRGMLTPESVVVLVKERDRQFWIIVNDEQPRAVTAAILTSIQIAPTGKKLLQIEMCAGDNVKEWFDLKDDLEKWAKENGCSGVLVWARKGWAKYLHEYAITQYLMLKEI